MGQLLDLLSLLLTLQVVAASTVLFLLNRYNTRLEKRFAEAHDVVGKRDQSLFELHAFRAAGSGSQNPFENTTWRLTWYEQLKLALLAVTVFPLRLLGVMLTFSGAYVVAGLLLRLGLRRAAKAAVASASRMLLFCYGYYWITVRGQQARGAGVVVSNHCTFLDGLVWMAISTPRPFVEESYFNNPMMQVFAKALDAVCFDRSSQDSRRMARQSMTSAAQAAADGHVAPILVFPEGTTKNLQAVITFKDGAFAPGVPVQAAVLRYRFGNCDPTWVFAGPSTPMLNFRLLCQVVNWLEIDFLPLSVPSEEERRDAHAFARQVQRRVAEAMGVPETEHAVEDLQFQLAAVKENLPAEVGVVGFAALHDVFSVDAKQIKTQMLVFKEMDRDGHGRVSFEQFKESFKRAFHKPSAAQEGLLRQFFEQLTGGQHMLDFRKFLIGLALVNESREDEHQPGELRRTPTPATELPQFEEIVDKYRGRIYAQVAFAAFAASSDDSINWKEFEELWQWLHPGLPEASAPRSPAGRQLIADQEALSAREIFDDIGGGSEEPLTFDAFLGYAERTPNFEKGLRQAFFRRIGSDLSPG